MTNRSRRTVRGPQNGAQRADIAPKAIKQTQIGSHPRLEGVGRATAWALTAAGHCWCSRAPTPTSANSGSARRLAVKVGAVPARASGSPRSPLLTARRSRAILRRGRGWGDCASRRPAVPPAARNPKVLAAGLGASLLGRCRPPKCAVLRRVGRPAAGGGAHAAASARNVVHFSTGASGPVFHRT